MKRTKLSFLALLFGISALHAQKNLLVTPEKPTAGSVIKITYIPAGEIANTLAKVEGIVYVSSNKERKADDLVLTKSGKKYTATITTDTSARFIQLGFFVDKKYDTNFGEGYVMNLYLGDKIKKGSYAKQAEFYLYYGEDTGLSKNNDKALSAYETEFSLYPETKKSLIGAYYRTMVSAKKEAATPAIQKEIESILKDGLKDETDYANLEGLYGILKLPEQGKFFGSIRKEKFPNGRWSINEKVQKYQAESDPIKKKELLAEIEKNVATNKDWATLESMLPNLRSSFANMYSKQKNWDAFKSEAVKLPKMTMASLYNGTAWRLQEKNEDLALAEELSQIAIDAARNEWKKPTTNRPAYATAKQWEEQREGTYAMFADTYAMVMYRSGQYQKGYNAMKEVAITISKGKDIDQNNTYSLLAEKALPSSQAFKEIEVFVREGNASNETRDVLKRLYAIEKKSEEGYAAYLENLEKESYLKMLEEIRKGMMNESTTQFSIVDINGNKISSADWKGKVVVVDFWATWCGPCIASFPAMQKAVTKFKDNANVKFVFINTWENGDNKQKKASDFITTNRYSFDVLMDTDNAVVEQFNVSGIPTKFILDKEGKIKFKSVGYSGDDDKLIAELSAMIEMANQ